jgi:hypothetical protein
MRDEYLREGIRNDDGPQRQEHDESVDLIDRERDESRQESDRRERLRGVDLEAHLRPMPAADSEGQRHREPEHGGAAELVDKGVVAREIGDPRERSRENVEGQANGERSDERDREDRPLERA